MSKVVKRALISALMLLMVLSIQLTANAKSQKKAALKAYKKILTEEKIWIYKKEKKVFSFALIYLDNNSIPELCVAERVPSAEGYYKTYTYYKRRVRALQLPSGIGSWYNRTNDMCSEYYKKTGFFVSDWGKQGAARMSYDYYPGKGKNINRVCSKTWSLEATDKASYYIGYVSGSQEQYNTQITKYAKGKKATKVKWHANTTANRKKYLK